jgi:hypothetical protein
MTSDRLRETSQEEGSASALRCKELRSGGLQGRLSPPQMECFIMALLGSSVNLMAAGHSLGSSPGVSLGCAPRAFVQQGMLQVRSTFVLQECHHGEYIAGIAPMSNIIALPLTHS